MRANVLMSFKKKRKKEKKQKKKVRRCFSNSFAVLLGHKSTKMVQIRFVNVPSPPK